MNPKLSIVIITRNRPVDLKDILDRCYLDEATAKRIELIVVDDNSDEENQFIAMQVMSDFHACTGLGVYEYLTSRRFPGGARNRGIELASGEYVWIADGDDMINWPAVQMILSELDARSRLPILMLDYESVSTDGSFKKVRFAGSNLKPWECGVMAWHKVIRRDLYGQFRDGVYGEDVDWWMRQCLDREMDYYHAPGIIGYTYRQLVPESVTATGVDKTEENRLRILEELKSIEARAKALNRPQAFIDHIVWMIKRYSV